MWQAWRWDKNNKKRHLEKQTYKGGNTHATLGTLLRAEGKFHDRIQDRQSM